MSTLAEIEAAAESLSQGEKEALLQFLAARLESTPEALSGFPSAKPRGKVSEWLRAAKGSVRAAAGEAEEDLRIEYFSAKYGVER